MSDRDEGPPPPAAVVIEGLSVGWCAGALTLRRDGANIRCTLWSGGPDARVGYGGVIPIGEIPAVIAALQALVGDTGPE